MKDDRVTGRKADVILAAHHAAEAALRLVKPGNEVRYVQLIACYRNLLLLHSVRSSGCKNRPAPFPGQMS